MSFPILFDGANRKGKTTWGFSGGGGLFRRAHFVSRVVCLDRDSDSITPLQLFRDGITSHFLLQGTGKWFAGDDKNFKLTKCSVANQQVGLANVGKSTLFQAITKSTLGNPAVSARLSRLKKFCTLVTVRAGWALGLPIKDFFANLLLLFL